MPIPKLVPAAPASPPLDDLTADPLDTGQADPPAIPDAASSGPGFPVAARLLRLTLPSLAVAGAVGALEVARSRFQRSRVFHPTRYPDGVWNPEIHGLPYEDVWFESEDGTRLHGWWVTRRRPVATVIFCHGNTGSLGDHVEVLLKLRALKVDVFAFDYRGYGRSHGKPSEAGLFADVRAACDHVHREYGVPFDRMVLFGHSLGGAVAVDGATHRPVSGLVVQSSFTQLRDMARHAYPDIPLHLIARNEFRSVEKVTRLEMPKLFIHGTDDATVPFAIGEALFSAAAGPKAWYPVPRAGHNDVGDFGGRRYQRTLRKFFRRRLG